MKFWPVKKYNTILKYVLTAITVTLLLVVAIFRWDTVKNVFAGIVNIFEPIIWGAVIAFIMNPIMMSTEKFLKRFVFRKKPRPKAARAIGVLVATAVFLALITMIILSVIPEIASNIPDIYNGIVNFLPKAQEWAESVLNDIPSVREIVVNELSDIGATLQGLLAALVPQINNFLTSLLDFADSVKNFVFGIIVAIYFLLRKADSIGAFMFELHERGEQLEEFDNRLWIVTVDTVKVMRDGSMVFNFRSGVSVAVEND